MSNPLQGLRILDLTSNVMGPYATQILGDMGADVIKVEAPEGDVTRYQGHAKTDLMGPLFLGLNRNKRSVVLDLKQESARAALLELAAESRVFVHSMRQPAIDKLGLGFDVLQQVRPDIVYCRATGFGSDGPYADSPAYDDLIQALSGMCALNATISAEPRFTPTVFADKAVGLTVAYAILGGLYGSMAHGKPHYVEVPMLETMVSFIMVEHLSGKTLDLPHGTAGYPRVLDANRRPYRTRDGYICVHTYTDRHWKNLSEFAGKPQWAVDPRVATLKGRGENFDLMFELIQSVMPQRETAQWLEGLRRADVPCAPVWSINGVFDDPHLRAVGMFSDPEHPTEGRVTHVRPPVRFDGRTQQLRHPVPKLGEHSAQVLLETGITPSQLEKMRETGATS